MRNLKKFNVLWTDVALRDSSAIMDFIACESPGEAQQVFERIFNAAQSLAFFPRKGRVVPELQKFGLNFYREIIVGPWRIIYRAAKRELWIQAVIDSRRNVEDILLDRLVQLTLT